MIMAGLFSIEIYDRTHFKGPKFKRSMSMITNTSGPGYPPIIQNPVSHDGVCVFVGVRECLKFCTILVREIPPGTFEMVAGNNGFIIVFFFSTFST